MSISGQKLKNVVDFQLPLMHNINMNRLDSAKRAQAIAALVEGNSVRAVPHDRDRAQHTVIAGGGRWRGLRGVPGQGASEPPVQADSVRRNLAILLREGQERPARNEGHVRDRFGVDMDGD